MPARARAPRRRRSPLKPYYPLYTRVGRTARSRQGGGRTGLLLCSRSARFPPPCFPSVAVPPSAAVWSMPLCRVLWFVLNKLLSPKKKPDGELTTESSSKAKSMMKQRGRARAGARAKRRGAGAVEHSALPHHALRLLGEERNEGRRETMDHGGVPPLKARACVHAKHRLLSPPSLQQPSNRLTEWSTSAQQPPECLAASGYLSTATTSAQQPRSASLRRARWG